MKHSPTPAERAAKRLAGLRDRAPYPWCRDPQTCALKGYCTRDPGCGD